MSICFTETYSYTSKYVKRDLYVYVQRDLYLYDQTCPTRPIFVCQYFSQRLTLMRQNMSKETYTCIQQDHIGRTVSSDREECGTRQFRCNALQHAATRCITRQRTWAQADKSVEHDIFHDNTLQQHCNTLQHTATHCNTLQHTTTYLGTGG